MLKIIDYTQNPNRQYWNPTTFLVGKHDCTIYVTPHQYNQCRRLWAYICVDLEKRNIKLEVKDD